MYKIRGHTLLCLQGFRGKGYSPEFVENMGRIYRNLSTNPTATVTVLDGPDQICGACPHLTESGCVLNGPGSEEKMIAQDREVLDLLELARGHIYSWGDILDRIAHAVRPESLDAICGDCRWLPLGYCREGIANLRSGPKKVR